MTNELKFYYKDKLVHSVPGFNGTPDEAKKLGESLSVQYDRFFLLFAGIKFSWFSPNAKQVQS